MFARICTIIAALHGIVFSVEGVALTKELTVERVLTDTITLILFNTLVCGVGSAVLASMRYRSALSAF